MGVGWVGAREGDAPAGFSPQDSILSVGNSEGHTADQDDTGIAGTWSAEVPVGPLAGVSGATAFCDFFYDDTNNQGVGGNGKMTCTGKIGNRKLVKGTDKFSKNFPDTYLRVTDDADLSNFDQTDVFTCVCKVKGKTTISAGTVAGPGAVLTKQTDTAVGRTSNIGQERARRGRSRRP